MKAAEIKFVRFYPTYGRTKINFCDVIYKSGRCVTRKLDDESLSGGLPSTVLHFVINAKNKTTQYDKIFDRIEVIYN